MSWWIVKRGRDFHVMGAPNCTANPDPDSYVAGPYVNQEDALDEAERKQSEYAFIKALTWAVLLGAFIVIVAWALRSGADTVTAPLDVPACDGCTKGGKVEYQAQEPSEAATFAYMNGWYCNEVEGVCLD